MTHATAVGKVVAEVAEDDEHIISSKDIHPRRASTQNANENDEDEISLFSYLAEKLNKFFIDHIPVESVHELPPGFMYSAGLLAYAAALGIFAYFASSSYQSTITQAFIAVDTSSGKCESVPIAITSSYLADSDGNWEGSSAFSYSKAKYRLSFNNFEVSSFSQYEQMMTIYYGSLVTIGSKAKTQNLPLNLLLWMNFIRYYSVASPTSTNFTSLGYGQLQYLEMTGSPQQVYSLASQLVSIGNFRGECPIHAHTDFDKANAIISTDLPYETFANTTLCDTTLPPEQFGYTGAVDGDVFLLQLNVETFSSAMSANLGYVDISDFTQSSATEFYLNFHNVTYTAAQYYDQRKTAMDPMWCIRNVTPIVPEAPNFETLCFYAYSRALGLPVMNHMGNSFSSPQYCDCATIGKSQQCNEFTFMSSLVFYPVDNSRNIAINTLIYQQMAYLLQLMQKYDSYEDFNRASFDASWTLSTNVFNRQDSNYTTAEWYNEAFGFAHIPNGMNGSMMVFTSMDTLSHLVSDYKYALTNGSCVDSFSIPQEDWSKLAQNSPVDLTQDYYKCYPQTYDAIMTALGIASGNTQLALPLTVVMLMPLLYGFLIMINRVPPKEEYTKLEKDEATEILALILLRLRDGKTRGIKKKGVLMGLTKELISAAKEDGGFPDSDDEEEEDEEEVQEVKRQAATKVALQRDRSKSGSRKLRTRPTTVDSDDEMDEEDQEEEDDDEDGEGGGGGGGGGGGSGTMYDDDIEANASRGAGGGAYKRGNTSQSSLHSPRKQHSSGPRHVDAAGHKKTTRGTTSAPGGGHGNQANNSDKKKKKKKAARMEVFTRHIDTRDGDGESYPSRFTMSLPSSAHIPTASPVTTSAASGQDPSLFSYFFGSTNRSGGKEEPRNTAGIELERYSTTNPLSYADAVEGNVPQDVVVLNQGNDQNSKARAQVSKAVKIQHLPRLVEDLVSSLSEAMNACDASGKVSLRAAKESAAYRSATSIAARLQAVPFEGFVTYENPVLFLQLANALTMHASIDLQVEMRQVELNYADRIAYNIGNKVVSAARLSSMLG